MRPFLSFHFVAMLLLACVVAARSSGAELQTAEFFGDHMVVQRGAAIAVWGRAEPGSDVRVTLGEHAAAGECGSGGAWRVELPARDAGGAPLTMTVESDGETISFRDVVVGDVWVCAGQSNMAFELSRSASFARDAAASTELPSLRLFDRRVRVSMSARPFESDALRSLRAESLYRASRWTPSSTETAPGFSAVAWTFGAALTRELDVPIGLIHCAVGGSPIEAWIPRAQLARDSELCPLLTDWLENDSYPEWPRGRARANLAPWLDAPSGPQPHHPFEPAILFDAAVAPLASAAFTGVLWYQGESNATQDGGGGRPVPAARNARKIQMLIEAWRSALGAPNLPFLMVQLPGMGREWPAFREAQASVARTDPDTYLAITLDLGNSTDVHPRRKRPVGERLARLALAGPYGRAITPTGPVLARVSGCDDAALLIAFRHAQGLSTTDGKAPRCFAIAGADGSFWPASAEITGTSVRVSSKDVPRPVAVRYGWENLPRCNLVNEEGLPAAPFRSDAWPLRPKVRVACIGDSITFGTGIDDRSRRSYPARLGELLGPDYDVRNFGRGGAGVVQRSMRGSEKRGYVFSPEHAAALNWEPDIVVSNLGVNDIMDWERFGRAQFVRDYGALMDSYQALRTEPKLLVWTPLTPLFDGHRFHADPLLEEIDRAIVRAAAAQGAHTVDLGASMAFYAAEFPDHIHPNAEAAQRIAKAVARAIRLGLRRR